MRLDHPLKKDYIFRKRLRLTRARDELRRRLLHSKFKPILSKGSAASVAESINKVVAPVGGASSPKFVEGRGIRRRPTTFIVPPADFSLRRQYDEVASFLSHLRDLTYNQMVFKKRPFAIDFSALKSLSPGAALILAAELYRIQKFSDFKLRAVKEKSWDPSIKGILNDLGLFELLQTPNILANESLGHDDAIEIIKYQVDDEVTGEKCGELLDKLAEIAGSINAEHFIYAGLVEALKNSKQHAYNESEQWFGVNPGTWFMTGAYNSHEQKLTAAVFDLGVGIPQTLPRSSLWEHVRPYYSKMGGTNDDGKMIAAAMEYGRSRTESQGRGNGLPVMMRLLDHHDGYLRIISGRGEVTYDSLTKIIQNFSHTESIGGTLIEWSIKK